MYTIDSRIITVSYISRILRHGMVIIGSVLQAIYRAIRKFKRKSHSDAVEEREYFRCVIRCWIAKK
jgi:hypothetical protein